MSAVCRPVVGRLVHLRDGHGLGPSMRWVGSHFPAHYDVMGLVGLNEKYCYFFAAFCVCYYIMC